MALWEEKDYGVLADRACWSMFAITAVVVALRVFCRVWYGSRRGWGLGLDDFITIGCLAVMMVTCVLITVGTHYGLGQHMEDLPPENIVPALKYNAIISSVLIWSFSLPKFAIISILQRILTLGTKTSFLFWGLALSSQACILATSIWWFKQCDPVARGWDRSVPGTCAPISVMANLGYFTSAYSAFLDVFFAIYPVPFIMRLQMPLRTRLAVATALGLSALACVVSIYKLAIFGQIFAIMEEDPTYPVPYLDILGVAECFILIVCASLPTLGPLFRAARGKFTTDASRTTGQLSVNRLEGSHGISAPGSRNCYGFKGHKLDSDIGESDDPSSLHLRPSFDAIPLVTTGQRAAAFDEDAVEIEGPERRGIHKTTEISVTSSQAPGFPGEKRQHSPGGV